MAPTLLDQDFAAAGPDEKWGADIPYTWTKEGWLYLTVAIDLFARRVVGGSWRTAFETRVDAAKAIGRYIDDLYNPHRRRSALDFVSPTQFEKRAAT